MKRLFFFLSIVFVHTACGDEELRSGLNLTTSKRVVLWPGGVIKYSIESGAVGKFPWAQKKDIRKDAEILTDSTNVTLIPVSSHESQLKIVPVARGCYASQEVRARIGDSHIYLGPRCSRGVVMHEMIHILGAIHEHIHPAAPLQFRMELVRQGMESQFKSVRVVPLTDYDPESIMHYDSRSFSICGAPSDPKWENLIADGKAPQPACRTVAWDVISVCWRECATVLNSDGGFVTSQRLRLTDKDIDGINALYSGSSE